MYEPQHGVVLLSAALVPLEGEEVAARGCQRVTKALNSLSPRGLANVTPLPPAQERLSCLVSAVHYLRPDKSGDGWMTVGTTVRARLSSTCQWRAADDQQRSHSRH